MSAYITNDEIAAYMDGFIKQSLLYHGAVADNMLTELAADYAVAHYRDTAKVTHGECMDYYAAYKAKQEVAA